jgi:hypothetical protein
MFVISNRQSAIASDAAKIEKAMATARSEAIRSGSGCYQVTIWADEKQFWIDGIDASDPHDQQTSASVAQPQIVAPESLQASVEFAKFEGGVPYTITKDGKTYQLRGYRFFPTEPATMAPSICATPTRKPEISRFIIASDSMGPRRGRRSSRKSTRRPDPGSKGSILLWPETPCSPVAGRLAPPLRWSKCSSA